MADFSLNGFFSSIDDSLQHAGLGGTSSVLDSFLQYKTDENKTKVAADTALKAQQYEQVTQKARATTGSTLPFDTKTILIGAGVIVAAVLVLKR